MGWQKKSDTHTHAVFRQSVSNSRSQVLSGALSSRTCPATHLGTRLVGHGIMESWDSCRDFSETKHHKADEKNVKKVGEGVNWVCLKTWRSWSTMEYPKESPLALSELAIFRVYPIYTQFLDTSNWVTILVAHPQRWWIDSDCLIATAIIKRVLAIDYPLVN